MAKSNGHDEPQRIVRVVKGPPPVLGPINLEVFRKECLEAHNKYRAMHGCAPLKISQELNKEAMRWAEHLAAKHIIQHQEDNKYGENLYMADNVEVPGSLPVKRWYDEIQMYDFNKSQFSSNTGHFTQVVWKNTKEVGIGAVRKASATFVVAEYDPAGNYQGQFKEMVPRKIRK